MGIIEVFRPRLGCGGLRVCALPLEAAHVVVRASRPHHNIACTRDACATRLRAACSAAVPAACTRDAARCEFGIRIYRR